MDVLTTHNGRCYARPKGGTETSRSSQKWDLLPLIYGILTQILDMLVMADLAIDFIFTILA